MPHATDPQLVAAFLETLRGKSTRAAEKLTGVSHQLVARYRRGRDRKGGWTYLKPETREVMQAHLRRSGIEPPEGPGALTPEETERLRELAARLPAAIDQGRLPALGLVEEMARVLGAEPEVEEG